MNVMGVGIVVVTGQVSIGLVLGLVGTKPVVNLCL